MSRANHLDEPTNEVGELKITYATELEGDWAEIAMMRQKFAWYPPLIHSMYQETRPKIIEGNKFMMQRQKAKGKVPKLLEVRGKVQVKHIIQSHVIHDA